MPIAQIHRAEIVEHRFGAAVVDLVVQSAEVTPMSPFYSADRERSISSLIASCRNNPTGFGEHYDVEKVTNFECVDALTLDSELGLGDHCLKSSNAALVATPVGFVCDKENAVLQMAVELADYFFARRDLETVLAEYPLQQTDYLCRRLGAIPHDKMQSEIMKLYR